MRFDKKCNTSYPNYRTPRSGVFFDLQGFVVYDKGKKGWFAGVSLSICCLGYLFTVASLLKLSVFLTLGCSDVSLDVASVATVQLVSL
jgi:hypothetical protein